MSENALGKANSDRNGINKQSSVCPTCNQEYKSPKGMRQHHKRTHGESIAKINLPCDRCGEDHKRWRSQLDDSPNYCSEECRVAALGESYTPEYKRKVISCSYCGVNTERRLSRIKRSDDLYCSRDCADNDHSNRVSGDGNPRWVGGYNDYYGEDWQKQRDKARKRDNFTCQRCNTPEEDLGHELSVHHKTPFRTFEDAKEANKLENLICFCKSCHGVVEAWPVQPI